MNGLPFLTLIAGLVLRFATNLHTLGDVLIWIGAGLIVLGLLIAVLVVVGVLAAGGKLNATTHTRRRR